MGAILIAYQACLAQTASFDGKTVVIHSLEGPVYGHTSDLMIIRHVCSITALQPLPIEYSRQACTLRIYCSVSYLS